jgi:hypothetical protein
MTGDPFTGQLQECHSVESINAFLQGEAQALSKLTGSMKIARGCCVGYLFTFATAAPAMLLVLYVRMANGMFCVPDACYTAIPTCPGNKWWPCCPTPTCMSLSSFLRPYPCNTQLCQATKRIKSSHDAQALAESIASIAHFLKLVDLCTRIVPTPAIDEI